MATNDEKMLRFLSGMSRFIEYLYNDFARHVNSGACLSLPQFRTLLNKFVTDKHIYQPREYELFYMMRVVLEQMLVEADRERQENVVHLSDYQHFIPRAS